MKKRIVTVIVVLTLCLLISGCAEKGTLEITYDEATQIQLKKEYQGLIWESSAPEIAAVENGVVTGKGPGQAVITAKQDGKTVAEYTVNVSVVKISDLFLQSEELTLKLEETATLSYTLFPTDASDYGISYTSINPEIAEVDQDGKITAVAPGKTKIVVSTEDGITANCTVTVDEPTALEQLNDDELRFFNYLTNTALRSFYNASAVRFRAIYAMKSATSDDVSAVLSDFALMLADIQGTNKLGGTLYRYYMVMPPKEDGNGGFLYPCVEDYNPFDSTDSIEYVEMPINVLDYRKLNAALDEYWGVTISIG